MATAPNPSDNLSTAAVRRKHLLLICALIFISSFGVRYLTFQDNRFEALKVQYGVTAGYKDSAHQLLSGEVKTFVSDINQMGHPPGYPLFLALIFKLTSYSDGTIQRLQIFFDSFAPVLIFLIALELTSLPVSLITALFAVISPQFSYFPILLLPDALVVLPLLSGFYFLLLARRWRALWPVVVAGFLFGISCWLRANGLLLVPFLVFFAPLFSESGKRLRASAYLLLGGVIAIAPITIKNAIVFHRFVPVSLGAGQTLLEGLSDYDPNGTLNIPQTDLGIMRQEAEWYGKPEYAQWLFGTDGIDRERMRLARGFSVIRSRPFWFTGVVAKRAIASMRLDPVPRLSPESPVGNSSQAILQGLQWAKTPREVLRLASGVSETSADNEQLRINGDTSPYGTQLVSEPIAVTAYHDYEFRFPLKLESGRVSVMVTGEDQTKTLASTGIDLLEGVSPNDQPAKPISMAFATGPHPQVRLAVANNASPKSTFSVGKIELYELGPSSQVWLRYVRIPIRMAQRIFTTAWMIPLTLIGIVLLIRERKYQTVALLLAVPAYYLVFQSMLHTERRYVYVIHFFFLAFVGTTIWSVVKLIHQVSSKQIAKSR